MSKKSTAVKRRVPKVGLRLAILLGGTLCFSLYQYLFHQDNILETTSDVAGGINLHSDRYEYGTFYHRNLDGTNTTTVYDDKCTNPDIQDSICVGYGQDSCKKLARSDMYIILFILLALLYLFIGIAIVCDELFVPALEIIAEDFQLSNDVAGATLMAAGGSAPELATSFVGAFKRSDVGFGTIVGSAVFNVLFVISMCVLFTPEDMRPLELTWWPLFRDCSYYILTLIFLAYFMFDGKIYWYEALIQFLLYVGYVVMMAHSERLEENFQKYLQNISSGQTIIPNNEVPDSTSETVQDPSLKSGSDVELVLTSSGLNNSSMSSGSNESTVTINRPSTFRAGILQILLQKTSIYDTVGTAFVSKIKGDVNDVFNRIDLDANGRLNKSEIKAILEELGTPEDLLTDHMIEKCMSEMDPDNKGDITKPAFTIWYTGNEERLRNTIRSAFERYDPEKRGIIARSDVSAFMNDLGHGTTCNLNVEQEVNEIESSNSEDPNFLTFEDFSRWYENSLYWQKDKNAAEQAQEASKSMAASVYDGIQDLFDPEGSLIEKTTFVFTLPLTCLFCFIPDCRPPGSEYLASFTLVGSIVMIAIFAIIMVELAEIVGSSIGIPDVVMGLTVLAAGTSVPDLLSSVIVAKQGLGDMAVSSSIGSNIFDVCFGLPLPWLVFNLVAIGSNCECPVIVESDGLFISLIVLVAMVAYVVLAIKYCEWKMSYALGASMFLMYFVYLGVSLGITPSREYKTDGCSPFKLF